MSNFENLITDLNSGNTVKSSDLTELKAKDGKMFTSDADGNVNGVYQTTVDENGKVCVEKMAPKTGTTPPKVETVETDETGTKGTKEGGGKRNKSCKKKKSGSKKQKKNCKTGTKRNKKM